jgi:hypothetical protein
LKLSSSFVSFRLLVVRLHGLTMGVEKRREITFVGGLLISFSR